METLDGMLDLGFALVRGKIRLGFILYRSGGVGICKGFKIGKKNPKLAHLRSAVPVPVSVVLVPKGYF